MAEAKKIRIKCLVVENGSFEDYKIVDSIIEVPEEEASRILADPRFELPIAPLVLPVPPPPPPVHTPKPKPPRLKEKEDKPVEEEPLVLEMEKDEEVEEPDDVSDGLDDEELKEEPKSKKKRGRPRKKR